MIRAVVTGMHCVYELWDNVHASTCAVVVLDCSHYFPPNGCNARFQALLNLALFNLGFDIGDDHHTQ